MPEVKLFHVQPCYCLGCRAIRAEDAAKQSAARVRAVPSTARKARPKPKRGGVPPKKPAGRIRPVTHGMEVAVSEDKGKPAKTKPATVPAEHPFEEKVATPGPKPDRTGAVPRRQVRQG